MPYEHFTDTIPTDFAALQKAAERRQPDPRPKWLGRTCWLSLAIAAVALCAAPALFFFR